MTKGRLEAFSDGVIAILITLMVLELRPPEAATWEGILHLWPKLATYTLSFLYLAIYWNNHHQMLHASPKINRATLWANMFLLFWLSLVPFGTAWVGEHPLARVPAQLYGANLLFAGTSYYLLSRALIRAGGPNSVVAKAHSTDAKGILSLVLYCVGIGLSTLSPIYSYAVYATVALTWLIPDGRYDKHRED